jgi:hypothetical protein
MTLLRWLHVSDSHYGQPEHSHITDAARVAMEAEIAKEVERGGPIDAIIFTGDVAYSGKAEQYAAADASIARLIRITGANHILATPGNHDIDRPAKTEALVYAAKHAAVDLDARLQATSEGSAIQLLLRNHLSHYASWWSKYAAQLSSYNPGLFPGEYSATVEKCGFRLGIVALNSCVAHLIDAHEEDIWIDPRQLNAACGDEQPSDWAARHDVTLLLTHHPPQWLSPQAKAIYRSEVYAHERFTAHLFGHTHEAATEVVQAGGGPQRITIQARSLCGLERFRARTGAELQRSHGFSIATIREGEVSNKLTLSLLARQLAKVADCWQIQPDSAVGGDLHDGVVLSIPTLRAMKSGGSTHRRPSSVLPSPKRRHGIPPAADSIPSLPLSPEPLVDTLPPRDTVVVDFVGRGPELEQLRSWLADKASRRHILVGEGGLGKTALAYELASEVKLSAPEPFRAVFWLSAKKRRFVDGETLAIASPDFSSLDAAVERLLRSYGMSPGMTAAESQELLLKALNDSPALLIVDDVDSLEGEDEPAIEFFTYQAPHTRSKVLMTSRRMILGMGSSTTQVKGLDEADCHKFAESQCVRASIDPGILKPDLLREIFVATSGSPLYIEDLIRFFCVSASPADAISNWKARAGDLAREYALGREFEKLTSRARAVLLAACLSPGAISHTELRSISNVEADALESALAELYRLFLVPKPSLKGGEASFNVNLNTKALVDRVAQSKYPDLYRAVKSAYDVLRGAAPDTRGAHGSAIRRAYFFVKNREYAKAESIILGRLSQFPDTPQLLGYLGWVYKAWEPARVTDARERFSRAYQLKWSDPEMYRHWCDMEGRLNEWTLAAKAAENGLSCAPKEVSLLLLAASAHNRLGRQFRGGLMPDKASREFRRAVVQLEEALALEQYGGDPRKSRRPEIFMGLVMNLEALGELEEARRRLNQWFKEFPYDEHQRALWQRLFAVGPPKT